MIDGNGTLLFPSSTLSKRFIIMGSANIWPQQSQFCIIYLSLNLFGDFHGLITFFFFNGLCFYSYFTLFLRLGACFTSSASFPESLAACMTCAGCAARACGTVATCQQWSVLASTPTRRAARTEARPHRSPRPHHSPRQPLKARGAPRRGRSSASANSPECG